MTSTAFHVAAGPRWSWLGNRAVPFVQFLAGVWVSSADIPLAGGGTFEDSDVAFMLQPGAGVYVPVGARWGVVGQADFRPVLIPGNTDNQFRIVPGASSLTTAIPGRKVVPSRRSDMGLLDVVDRRAFIASLGGAAAVAAMGHEERAEALEHYAEDRLNELVANSQGGAAQGGQDRPFPTVAELEAQVETRTTRRGLGNIFGNGRGNVRRLEKMSEKPTIHDFFRLRFQPANHVLQSATRALKTGMKEEVILACLLHDVALNLMHVDHGWWGAQMFEPYVPEKTSFAIRYHQTLRFYADEEAGYEYPDSYHRTFGIDYVPPPHIQAAYKMLRNHKWYMEPRLVTVNDLYSFDPNAVVSIDPFADIIGRHFKQPKEGLGNDNSPVAHMWRTLANPDAPL